MSDDDDDLYMFTDDEIKIIRQCLRMEMERLDDRMKYNREYSTTRREEYDDIRELYIKLGGK